MSYLYRTLLALVFAASILVGCMSAPAPIRPGHTCPSAAAETNQPVTPLSELRRAGQSPVVALDFAPTGNELISVYASTDKEPGQVLVWNLETGKVVQARTLEWIHPQLTSLSMTGNLLATIENRYKVVAQQRADFDYRVSELAEVWDVMSGERHKLLGWNYFAVRAIDISLKLLPCEGWV